MWFDSHCHLEVASAAEAIEDARAAGVARLVTIGTDVPSSKAAIEIAARFDGVYATAGVHPHEARHGMEGLAECLDAPPVVAVGEAGLDYYYEHSPREVQRDVFAQQIALANSRSLPLVIHSRDAWDDTFALLRSAGTPDRTVFHCFTGGPAEAQIALDLGCWLSFSGIVTFSKATDVQAAAEACPADRLLIETDTPYLAPVPYRGKQNRPAWVVAVGTVVAELRGVAVEDLAAVTSANAAAFFGIDP